MSSPFGVVSTATPESFAAHQRKIKHEERKAREARAAGQVAKARAARYNLTLRANELKKLREEGEKARAATAGAGARDEAAPPEPAAAPSSQRASLAKRVSQQVSGGLRRLSLRSSRRSSSAAQAASPAPKESPEPLEDAHEAPEEFLHDDLDDIKDVDEGDEEEEEEDEEDEEEEEVVLWMGELARALEQQETHEINAAILMAFLTEMAPDRVGEVDDLLEEYEGREEELFDQLAQEYPASPESRQRLNDETLRALGAEIPDEATGDGEEEGYILSLMSDHYGKWAANVQSHILRQRMLQAGASMEDVDAVVNNTSDMI